MSTARKIDNLVQMPGVPKRLEAPKPARKPKVEKAIDPPEDISKDVVGQIRLACKPENRLATAVGFLLGGFVPLAIYKVSHGEIGSFWELKTVLVIGGLVYSASTVYEWGKLAFRSGWKAMGFLVLTEGVMMISSTPWLGITALVYLVVINGIGTGVNLALKNKNE